MYYVGDCVDCVDLDRREKGRGALARDSRAGRTRAYG